MSPYTGVFAPHNVCDSRGLLTISESCISALEFDVVDPLDDSGRCMEHGKSPLNHSDIVMLSTDQAIRIHAVTQPKLNRGALDIVPAYLTNQSHLHSHVPTDPDTISPNQRLTQSQSALQSVSVPSEVVNTRAILPARAPLLPPTSSTSLNESQRVASPSPQISGSSVSEAPKLSQPSATGTSVIQSESDGIPLYDQATPLPIPPHFFTLSNSTEVITATSSKPRESPAPPSRGSEPQTVAFRPLTHHFDGDTKASTRLHLPYLIALVLPAIFFLVLSVLAAYRCTQRKKHSLKHVVTCPSPNDNESRKGYPSQSLGAFEGFSSTIEKGRHSITSNSSSVLHDGDVKMHNITLEESKLYSALPPIPGCSPLFSGPATSVHNSNQVFESPSKADTNQSSDCQVASEVTPCKQNCVVIRTFTISLPDELMIGIGDRVVVHLLFGDAWCLGENLDIERHQTLDGKKYSQMGILPQECLSGLDCSSVYNATLISKIAAEQVKSQHLKGENELEALAETRLISPAVQVPLAPFTKPHRASSLHMDRETNLFRELERALASSS